MIQTVQMKIIARIHSDFDEKFGIPRQSGLVDSLRAKIVFEPEFRAAEAVRGLEGFSHVWLIWQFSQAVRENWSPTVRPPPRARPSVPTPSAYPASGWITSSRKRPRDP